MAYTPPAAGAAASAPAVSTAVAPKGDVQLATSPSIEEDRKRHRKCHTCPNGDDDEKPREPSGAAPSGASPKPSDGEVLLREKDEVDQFDARQAALSQSKYVQQGGAFISAPDGGFHMSADRMTINDGGGTFPGYHTGFTGVLQQQSLEDCTTVATVNKMALVNGWDADTAQRMAMKMDAANGLIDGSGVSRANLYNGLTAASYSNVSIGYYDDLNVDGTRLVNEADRAQTLNFSAPGEYWRNANIEYEAAGQLRASGDIDGALAKEAEGDRLQATGTRVFDHQKDLGLSLPGTTGHAMTIESVTTSADGTKMANIINPWGVNYHIPVSELGNYGVNQIAYGDMPGR